MIREAKLWAEWEDRYTASQPVDFRRNLALYDAMYEQARFLGVFSLDDSLRGLDTDIRVAKALNSLEPSDPRRRES